jgi:hypothetical protein
VNARAIYSGPVIFPAADDPWERRLKEAAVALAAAMADLPADKGTPLVEWAARVQAARNRLEDAALHYGDWTARP